MNRIEFAPGYFPSPTVGKPVSSGYIYIGTVDLDPEIVANRKQVYALQEDTTVVAIPQPIRTGAGGVPTYNNATVTLLVDGNYSMKVMDKDATQVYYFPANAKAGYNSDTIIRVDATSGAQAVSLPSANDPYANITIIYKPMGDISGNAATMTPLTGTVMGEPSVAITGSSETVRLLPDATDNNWYLIS